MRVLLHPAGIFRLFSNKDATPKPALSKEAVDPDKYEVTPYGRRPRRTGRERLMLTAKILAVGGVVGGVAWALI